MQAPENTVYITSIGIPGIYFGPLTQDFDGTMTLEPYTHRIVQENVYDESDPPNLIRRDLKVIYRDGDGVDIIKYTF